MAEKTVQELVTEGLAGIGPEVSQSVVNIMVEREVKKRSEILVQGLDLLQSSEREFLRLKADVEIFNEAGEAEVTYYSKQRTEERKKGKERIEKLKKALEKALTKGDFQDLNNAINNSKSQKPKSGTDTEGDTE